MTAPSQRDWRRCAPERSPTSCVLRPEWATRSCCATMVRFGRGATIAVVSSATAPRPRVSRRSRCRCRTSSRLRRLRELDGADRRRRGARVGPESGGRSWRRHAGTQARARHRRVAGSGDRNCRRRQSLHGVAARRARVRVGGNADGQCGCGATTEFELAPCEVVAPLPADIVAIGVGTTTHSHWPRMARCGLETISPGS